MKRVQYHGIHTFSSRTFCSPQKGACVSTEPSNLSFLQHDTSPPLSMTDSALLGWGCNASPLLDDSHQCTSVSCLCRSSTVDIHARGSAAVPSCFLCGGHCCDTQQLLAHTPDGHRFCKQGAMGTSKVSGMDSFGCQLDYI